MAQFLHISFHVRDAATLHELAPVFDKALDWLSYTPNCWIVWTSSSHEEWYARMKPRLPDGDYMFIATLDLRQGYTGWLPKWAWDWLSKAR